MEITTDALQERIDGMTQQLGRLMNEAAQVQGALNLATALLRHLAAPDLSELGELIPGEPPKDLVKEVSEEGGDGAAATAA